MSEMSRTPEHATDDAPASAGVATARRGLLDLLDEMLGKTGPVTGDLPALDLLEQLVGRAQEVVPGADHFFTGHLDELVAVVQRYLNLALQPIPEAAVATAR